jgi:NitT/TauT family transport system permease protein
MGGNRIFWAIALVTVGALLCCWQFLLGTMHPLVVYFGRPADVGQYSVHHLGSLLSAAFLTTATAVLSVLLSGILAAAFLILAVSTERLLQPVERIAAASQTVPMLVIVTFVYLIEKPIIDHLGSEPPLLLYCLVPVSIVLFFPALAYAIDGVRNLDIEIKSMLRVWDAPQRWRIRQILLPHAMPYLLVGLRVSAAWAVLAAIIAEGLIGSQGRESATSLGIGLMRPFSSGAPPGKTPSLFLAATLMGFLVYYLFDRLEHFGHRRFLGFAGVQERDYPICRSRRAPRSGTTQRSA